MGKCGEEDYVQVAITLSFHVKHQMEILRCQKKLNQSTASLMQSGNLKADQSKMTGCICNPFGDEQ